MSKRFMYIIYIPVGVLRLFDSTFVLKNLCLHSEKKAIIDNGLHLIIKTVAV